ncbi:peptidoglycan-binding domain 1 protein [Mycobacteroides abscessus subsp. bolletii]|uniref:peptidoglycan recognition protein family protein n=1 Tax=Mycobacteroides abscessus TaxID=36809 RepID=UPI0009A55D3B|nr:N-acetylmuramoyl-L-alanine amidase [Mycobacteroides abscessus]SKR94568.1 peptidoglycan-binding domain 1 protein [Mycobacteroides abscessus subsp. bolletii]SKS02887.1 peptidoglycan-binding domain 1 protein [Mycobacteroides abscessus subsp. bolletii]DAZ90164.1 TPA_asm: lysin A [Mycobacterium phage prophiFVLQ01-1]
MMRFTRSKPMMTREEIAREVISAAAMLGVEPKGVKIALATIAVEVGTTNRDSGEYGWWRFANIKDPQCLALPHDAEGDDGYSSGYFQQQAPKGANWGWGGLFGDPVGAFRRMDIRESSRMFLEALLRLPYDYRGDSRSPGQMAQDVQRSAFPDRYDERWREANEVYNRAVSGNPGEPAQPSGPWTGDPVWLADVLRAEGVTVVECSVGDVSWLERGHGDMGSLWGVVNHHTGSNGSTWRSIWDGRTDLRGPLSHIHLRRDGVAELVAVGVCWHAGTGAYGDLRPGTGNQRTIGIECQNDGGGSSNLPLRHRSSWPDAQYEALVKINAAINRRLGVDASRSISHKEYDDGDPQTDEGKWDPGQIDMDIFRADVQRQIGSNTGGFLMALSDDEQREILGYVREQREIVESLSPLRHLGEKKANNIAGYIRVMDANSHVEAIEKRAGYGDAKAIELLEEIAGADPDEYPDRQRDAELARRILAKVRGEK